jgi:hypothetical protein
MHTEREELHVTTPIERSRKHTPIYMYEEIQGEKKKKERQQRDGDICSYDITSEERRDHIEGGVNE